MPSVLDKQLAALDAARPGLEGLAHGWEIALWTATAICALGVIVEIVAVIAEVCENKRRKKPIPKYEIAALVGAILVALAVVGEGVFEFEGASVETRLRGNSESVETVLNEKAIGAGSEAFKAIDKAGGLEKYVQQKTSEIDKTISDLNEAQKRAKESLAKIDPLAKRQEGLSREITIDEGKLTGDEKRLADEESQADELMDEISGRSMLGDLGDAPKSPLRKFADVPIFLSVGRAAWDADGVRRGIGSIVQSEFGQSLREVPEVEYDSMVGVRVTYAEPVVGQRFGGTVDVDAMQKMEESLRHSRDAAAALCRRLKQAKLADVSVMPATFDPDSKMGNPEWDSSVPIRGLIIDVGPAARTALEGRRYERLGLPFAKEKTNPDALAEMENKDAAAHGITLKYDNCDVR